jgi:F0F1-type ATP synthase assembly protein I
VKQNPNKGFLLRMGWVIVLATLVPLGLGLLLDDRLGTSPLFVLVLASFGIMGGTIGIVRIASRRLEALGTVPQAEANSDSPVNGEEDSA